VRRPDELPLDDEPLELRGADPPEELEPEGFETLPPEPDEPLEPEWPLRPELSPELPRETVVRLLLPALPLPRLLTRRPLVAGCPCLLVLLSFEPTR
jgi:hypothetical protein